MSFNYWLYRFKYRYAKQLNLSKPVDLSIELSSACNQSCSYCYHGDPANLPFKKGMMNHHLVFNLLEQAHWLGVSSLKFNYRGESTLHPKFEAITANAKNRAYGSVFIDRITNSNFKFPIKNDSIFRGLCNQTKVKISFDSFIPGVMETQRAGSNMNLALANMNRFYNWKGRKNTMVVQAVRTRLNKDEDIEAEVKKRWPDAICNINDMVAGRTSIDLSKYFLKDRDLDNRQSCIQAHARLIVNWDGLVTVCCPDIGSKLIVGDSNKQELKDIWNGPKARSIRNDLKTRQAFKKEPCKSCPSFESYKGFSPKWNS